MKKGYPIFSGVFFLVGIVMLYCNALLRAYVAAVHHVQTSIITEYHLYIFPVGCFLIALGLIFLPLYFKK